jgi:Zn-finger nucleic acid-binding protein
MTETQFDSTLTCLKCGGAMRTYERSGVLIDQCTECRGVFLDRAELDRIVDAEVRPDSRADGDDRRPTVEPRRPGDDRRPRDGDDDGERWPDGHDQLRRREQQAGAGPADDTQRRKRGGLLGDVFDIFGGE